VVDGVSDQAYVAFTRAPNERQNEKNDEEETAEHQYFWQGGAWSQWRGDDSDRLTGRLS